MFVPRLSIAVSLPVYTSVYVFVTNGCRSLSVCLSIYLCKCLYHGCRSLSVCLSIHLCTCLYQRMSITVSLSVYTSCVRVYTKGYRSLSVCLSIHLVYVFVQRAVDRCQSACQYTYVYVFVTGLSIAVSLPIYTPVYVFIPGLSFAVSLHVYTPVYVFVPRAVDRCKSACLYTCVPVCTRAVDRCQSARLLAPGGAARCRCYRAQHGRVNRQHR